MMSKWLLTAVAAAVMFGTTIELGRVSARHRPVAAVRADLYAPELGLPTVTEAGAEPAASTSLTR
ncbi:MAG: hypothetical protein ACRELS_19445 [Candidatus Rokuibacteriota bacterium]